MIQERSGRRERSVGRRDVGKKGRSAEDEERRAIVHDAKRDTRDERDEQGSERGGRSVFRSVE